VCNSFVVVTRYVVVLFLCYFYVVVQYALDNILTWL